MRVNYYDLTQSIGSLTHGETDIVALMATVACEVHHFDDRFDWTGFYRVTAPELLKIGPYQGGHGCLVIPFSRGVCGAAARTGAVQLVADVECLSGPYRLRHLSTRSEIVLPVLERSRHALGRVRYRQQSARGLHARGRDPTGRDPQNGLRSGALTGGLRV